MKNKIIFLIDTPFNKRDYDRFGIGVLRDLGFEILIWDALSLVKRFCGTPPDACSDESLTKFKKKSEITSAIKVLNTDTWVVALLALKISTMSIYRQLNNRKIPCLSLSLGCIPTPEISLIDRLRQIGFRWAVKKVEHYIIKMFAQYKPCLSLVGGASQILESKMVHSHSLDYDIFLKGKNNKKVGVGNDYAVFIDVGEADYYHQDLKIAGVKKFISSKHYFPEMQSSFDWFEKKYELPIIIAGHPRVRYSEKVYGDRDIIYEKTPDLVRNAKVVLMHYSTSINLAVLYRKPIVFIRFNNKYRRCINKLYPDCFADNLKNSNRITMGNKDSYKSLGNDIFCVDEKIYQAYQDKYIKAPYSPEKNTWEIFADYIQENTI